MPLLTRSLIAVDETDVASVTAEVSSMRVAAVDVTAASQMPAAARVVAACAEEAAPVVEKQLDDVMSNAAVEKQPETRLGSPPHVAAETDAWWKVRTTAVPRCV